MPSLALSPQRKFLGDLYRPRGVTYITTVAGLGFAAGAGAGAGFTKSVTQQVDLTLPIRGFRFVIKGRVTVGTAGYSAVNPESLLNLISNLTIKGSNTRINSNVTLNSLDLASLFGFQSLTATNFKASIIVNNSLVARAGLPYANIAALGSTGNYDFIITIDVPTAPFGASPGVVPQWLIRQSEWKDSVNFSFTFPSIADNAANALGTSAATTTTAISALGSSTGNMTVDIYSLPVIMGSAQNSVVPGVLSRVTSPIDSILQATKNNAKLLVMEKQATSRVYAKIGVAASSPIFTSLSDAILTAVGIQVGTSKNVRDKLDIYAHRAEAVDHYGAPPIQGYYVLDFLQSGNPDSAYAADSVLGDGQTFNLIGDVTQASNAAGLILQEQIIVPAVH